MSAGRADWDNQTVFPSAESAIPVGAVAESSETRSAGVLLERRTIACCDGLQATAVLEPGMNAGNVTASGKGAGVAPMLAYQSWSAPAARRSPLSLMAM